MQEPGGELTTQLSTLTLTPQHSLTPQSSTESTSDPPGYSPQQQQVSWAGRELWTLCAECWRQSVRATRGASRNRVCIGCGVRCVQEQDKNVTWVFGSSLLKRTTVEQVI